MNNAKAEKKLEEIKLCLDKKHSTASLLNLSRGQLGISLFYHTYYKYTHQTTCFDRSQELFSNTVKAISSAGDNNSLFRELVDLGKYLIWLYRDQAVEDDAIFLINQVRDVLISMTMDKIKRRNFDPVIGAISSGYFFLEKLKYLPDDPSQQILLMLIHQLTQTSIKNSDGVVYWKSNFRQENSVELGISHGVTGVLLFLTRVYQARIFNDIDLIKMGLAFVLRLKRKVPEFSIFFPIEAHEHGKGSKMMNLAYGDLGVTYVLHECAKVLGDDSLKQEAEEIFKFYASDQCSAEYGVYDTNLLYGSSGPSILFRKLFLDSNLPVFETASNYWLKLTLRGLSTEQNEFAGFVPYWNAIYPDTYTSIAEGVSGIGLALLYLKDPKFNSLFSVINFN